VWISLGLSSLLAFLIGVVATLYYKKVTKDKRGAYNAAIWAGLADTIEPGTSTMSTPRSSTDGKSPKVAQKSSRRRGRTSRECGEAQGLFDSPSISAELGGRSYTEAERDEDVLMSYGSVIRGGFTDRDSVVTVSDSAVTVSDSVVAPSNLAISANEGLTVLNVQAVPEPLATLEGDDEHEDDAESTVHWRATAEALQPAPLAMSLR
jgi:hypothetical protein